MSLADDLVQRWYDGSRRPWLLRPLTWLYRALVALRAWMYQRHLLHGERLSVPVLVVGNISLGGTGKTPLVIALTEYLRGQGWQPGVVSRGYGGTEEGPVLLPDMPEAARFGDEPCLIRRRTGVPVAVGRDRPAAAKRLVDAGCDVIIADDGLQHYRLLRDVEICVIDGVRQLGNGLMLPCGPLREPPSRLQRVDFCVVNGGDAHVGEVPMTLVGDSASRLTHVTESRPLRGFADQPLHAVAGIGNPARFFDSLRGHGLEIIEHAFADHHAFVPENLDFGDELPILMTEKDAVKCAAFAGANAWSVPIKARLPDAFLQTLHDRLRNLKPL